MKVICPVCEKEYPERIQVCTKCGFSELNKIFLSEDDKRKWKRQLIETTKALNKNYTCNDLSTVKKEFDKTLFGKTIFLMSKHGYLSKSQITKLEHNQEAEEWIRIAKEKVKSIRDYAKAMEIMKKEVEQEKSKVWMYQGKIDANLTEISHLIDYVRNRVVANLKALDIKEIDFSDLEMLHEYLDFDKIQRNLERKWQIIKEIIEVDYRSIKATIKNNYDKFGYLSEYEVEKIDLETDSGKQEIHHIIGVPYSKTPNYRS